jgi:hypothetical protein
MANTRTDDRKRTDAWWLDQWKKTNDAFDKREEQRNRNWPGHLKEQEGRARYSPWLVAPCHARDYGLRPLASGVPYWASPFIWTESPDPSGNPLAGAENHLVARIFNVGSATAAPTKVDFYWADPSVGLGAGDAHFIGTEFVEVQPMTSRVVRCATPWVPSYLNGGHECVFVQCDNHVLDPLRNPFEPWNDRHVGQRNLAVLPPVAQTFMLWAPAGMEGVREELRVTAMRGALRTMANMRRPAAQVFGEAAARLLAGLFPTQATVRRMEAKAQPMQVAGRVIEAAQVIAAAQMTNEIRRSHCAPPSGGDCHCKDLPPPGPHMPACDATALGERLLTVEGEPAGARRIAVQLRAVALQPNEFVVLNLTWLAAGAVRGGYVLVLAPAGWFKDSTLDTTKDDDMHTSPRDHGGDALQELVIDQFPQARLTLEIARVLQRHLPIKSVEELEKIAEYGSVGKLSFDKSYVARMGLESLLPIRDEKDLVRKIAGVMSIAAHRAAPGTGGDDRVASIAGAMLDKRTRAVSIPTHHFAGESLFGFVRAKGE